MSYECDLVIFDQQGRCLLFDGEYEIELLNSCKSITFSAQNKQIPIIKFRIAWTKYRYRKFVDWPQFIAKVERDNQNMMSTNEIENKADFLDNYNQEIRSGVNYHFIFNKNANLITQESENYICPWCYLNCTLIYSLLKHLKLCHARFTFTFVPSSGSKFMIQVRINEKYNGSYTGSPQDMIRTVTAASRRKTAVLFFRCKVVNVAKKFNMSEFFEENQDYWNCVVRVQREKFAVVAEVEDGNSPNNGKKIQHLLPII